MAVPPQCPDCGRFLKRSFVETLLAEAAPCPKCAESLSAIEIDGELEVVLAAPGGAEATAEPSPSATPITTAVNGYDAATGSVVTEAMPTGAITLTEDEGGWVAPAEAAVAAEDEDEVVADELAATDVLAGWDDRAPEDEEILDAEPSGPDAATVLGLGAAAGAITGLVVATRRARGALAGAIVGVLGAIGAERFRGR